MPGIIITNNPRVLRELAPEHDVSFHKERLMDLFVRVRDLVHKGHRLYTHPLSGSIKPGETPYKSILVSKEPGVLDFESLQMVENAILTTRKFGHEYRDLPDSVDLDFQLVDYTLIKGVL